jgi:hypothetical protein
MPMLRTQLPIPSIGLILPVILIFGLGAVKIFTTGKLYLRINIAGHFYFLVFLFVYLLASAIWNPFEVSSGDAVLKIIPSDTAKLLFKKETLPSCFEKEG